MGLTGVDIDSKFNPQFFGALDRRNTTASIVERDAIEFKYDGMIVYVSGIKSYFRYIDGSWIADGGHIKLEDLLNTPSSVANGDILIYDTNTEQWLAVNFEQAVKDILDGMGISPGGTITGGSVGGTPIADTQVGGIRIGSQIDHRIEADSNINYLILGDPYVNPAFSNLIFKNQSLSLNVGESIPAATHRFEFYFSSVGIANINLASIYIRESGGADLIPDGEADKYIDNLQHVSSLQFADYVFAASIIKLNHLDKVTHQLLGKNTNNVDIAVRNVTVTWYEQILYGNHPGDGNETDGTGSLPAGMAHPTLSPADAGGFIGDLVPSISNYIGSSNGTSFNWWLIPINLGHITIDIQNIDSALDLAKVGIFGSGSGLVKQPDNIIINNGFVDITYHVFRSENASGSINFQIKV